MNSTERVRNLILGKEYDRQPIYGWGRANLEKEINEVFGSVENFEDKYEFDMAHIFGGPGVFNSELIEKIRSEKDMEILNKWFLLAIKAKTISEFEAAM